jgi:hypothetical protein
MRKEYDFSKAGKNPYAAQLKKQITILLNEDSIGYFAADADISAINSDAKMRFI